MCPKKAAVLLQVIKNLEDRIKGTAIQRQVNVNASEPTKKTKSELDMSEVERKLMELEKQLGVENDTRDNNKTRVLRKDDSADEREDSGDSGDDSIPTSSRMVEPDTTKSDA